MSQEETTQKKKISSLVIGLIVACLILAGGVGYLIYTKMSGGEEEAAPVREPGILFKLGDAKDGLIVNIGGVNSGRYLKISIIVELKPEEEAAAESKDMTVEQAKILDAVLQLLRAQKVEDFDPNKQFELKELIKNEISQQIGEDRVYEVYITNFILQ